MCMRYLSCINYGGGRQGIISVLECVEVCCSVLQCAAVCCSVLQCAAVSDDVGMCRGYGGGGQGISGASGSTYQSSSGGGYQVYMSCCMLQRVAVCCSELQCVGAEANAKAAMEVVLRCVCVAVCCSALQCVAVCCSVLERQFIPKRQWRWLPGVYVLPSVLMSCAQFHCVASLTHAKRYVYPKCRICPSCFRTCRIRHTRLSLFTLQNTVTYCNTLQHTATHCNPLQHTDV